MYTKVMSDYEKFYSLDVLGVEDRGENDQLDVYKEFRENIVRQSNGRYDVKIPWIPEVSSQRLISHRAEINYKMSNVNSSRMSN